MRENELGSEFPDDLKSFYLYSNGLSSSQRQYTFAKLDSLSLDWFEGWPYLEDIGLLPVLEANDSNPLCVVTRGPLYGMVAHIFHDGDTCLRFASVADMFRCFAAASSFHEAYHTVALRTLPPASGESFAENIYNEMIAELDPADREGNSLRLRFAMDLCPDAESTRIADLISLGDEHVRYAALSRLREVNTDESRRALAEDDREYRAFVDMVSRMGSEDQVRRFNMPMLFASRNDPDFNDRLKQLPNRT